MRVWLGIFSAVCLMQTTVRAEELYRIIGSPACIERFTPDITGRAFQSGMKIEIEVHDWRRLAEEEFRTRVLNTAFNENLNHCRSKNVSAGLAAVVVTRNTWTLMIAWMPSTDQKWRISVDRLDRFKQQDDNAEARRREHEARDAARREALKKAEEARRLPIALPDYDVDEHCRTTAKGTGLPNAADIAIRCIGVQQAAYDRLKPLWPQATPEFQHDCRDLNDRPSWQRALMEGSWPYESLLHCIIGKLRAAQSEKQLDGIKFKK